MTISIVSILIYHKCLISSLHQESTREYLLCIIYSCDVSSIHLPALGLNGILVCSPFSLKCEACTHFPVGLYFTISCPTLILNGQREQSCEPLAFLIPYLHLNLGKRDPFTVVNLMHRHEFHSTFWVLFSHFFGCFTSRLNSEKLATIMDPTPEFDANSVVPHLHTLSQLVLRMLSKKHTVSVNTSFLCSQQACESKQAKKQVAKMFRLLMNCSFGLSCP